MTILLNPLQLVLWGPLQPPLVGQSQGISFASSPEPPVGAFSADYSTDFDTIDAAQFGTDFNNDFAIRAFRHDFSLDFNRDFAAI